MSCPAYVTKENLAFSVMGSLTIRTKPRVARSLPYLAFSSACAAWASLAGVAIVILVEIVNRNTGAVAGREVLRL
jgi:hypothetical protein